MTNKTPHLANVPGDFNVVDNCCTMCEVPFSEAPGLFGRCDDPQGYQHCYVKRQPEMPAELDQMLMTIRCAEFECIRYRGMDGLVQLRLIAQGEGRICDTLTPDLQQEMERLEAEERRQHRRARRGAGPPASSRPWWRFW